MKNTTNNEFSVDYNVAMAEAYRKARISCPEETNDISKLLGTTIFHLFEMLQHGSVPPTSISQELPSWMAPLKEVCVKIIEKDGYNSEEGMANVLMEFIASHLGTFSLDCLNLLCAISPDFDMLEAGIRVAMRPDPHRDIPAFQEIMYEYLVNKFGDIPETVSAYVYSVSGMNYMVAMSIYMIRSQSIDDLLSYLKSYDWGIKTH